MVRWRYCHNLSGFLSNQQRDSKSAMTESKLYLRDKDKQRLLKLLADYLPNVTAWAYGSWIKGEAHEASDLDLVLRSTDLSRIPN